MKKIAYQGEEGANSHIACLKAFPNDQHVPFHTFDDALNAIKAGVCDLGMIPVENIFAGRVADIHHLLPNAGLHIVGEHFEPVHHQWLAVHSANIDDIITVQSHFMAFGQCRNLIRERKLTIVVGADTAGSAREISEAGDITRSVLASELAGKIYNLKTLASDVEDDHRNTTRFLILSNTPHIPSPDAKSLMSTFVFRVRNVPAALYKALGGFATNSVNMTKLESYMVNGEFAATQFYADVEGHPEHSGLKNALEELSFFSEEVRILGVYPMSDYRKNR